MSVEQANVIDFVGISSTTGKVNVAITDHLDWNDPRSSHLMLLQEKINTYLSYIESGEIYQKIPEAKEKSIVIQVYGKYELNDLAKEFYQKASEIIANAGLELEFIYKSSDV